MTTLYTSVRVVLGTPSPQHSENVLALAIPILNAGEVALGDLTCTDVTLGTVTRASPPLLPLHLGTIGPRNTVTLLAKFSGAAPGSRLLLTVRGTYRVGGASHGLSLSRFLTVPTMAASPTPTLRARVVADTGNAVWNYTLVNDEPPSSRQHVASFSLQVASQVTVTGTPPGWRAETDHATHVLWVSDDFAPPYPSHVAPGQSLSGFQLISPRPASEAGAYSLGAWDHAADDAGLLMAEYTATPRR